MCEHVNENMKCNKKTKYGNYCYKHRSCFLCNENYTIFNRFTNKESDYTIFQLRSTLHKNKISINKSQKKKELFDIYINFTKSLNNYDIDKLIKIQKFIKKRSHDNNIRLKGPGFLNRELCNNSEDFFTYDSVNDIENKYFISFKDKNKFIWCFDIRSINKLLENDNKNPYTREVFPVEFLDRINIQTKILKQQKVKMNYNSEIIKERKENIKQITVDLFSEIEISGYDCNINWFLNLNLEKLKKLYRVLEDIWNYRAQLTDEFKRNLVPPNGRLFTKPVYQVNRLTNKRELQELIINEVSKFKNAITSSDKTLGFMYFLVGLSHVSVDCWNTYNHLLLL